MDEGMSEFGILVYTCTVYFMKTTSHFQKNEMVTCRNFAYKQMSLRTVNGLIVKNFNIDFHNISVLVSSTKESVTLDGNTQMETVLEEPDNIVGSFQDCNNKQSNIFWRFRKASERPTTQ